MDKKKPSLKRSLGIGLAVFFIILMYAYGFQVTDLSLEETRNERRQTSLVRVLRALAHPEIITFDKEEFIVSLPFYVDCPAGGAPEISINEEEPYLVATPACAGPEDKVLIEGYNFEPNTVGPINFIPPSGVKLQLGSAAIDSDGRFISEVELPNRSPVEEAQEIRVTTRRNIGSPMFTQTAYDTWDKIVETVFMALLATTFGTILAIPISFFAARNLMRDVTSPLASAALSIIGWPIGVFVGLQLVSYLTEVTTALTTSMMMSLGGTVVGGGLTWALIRWAIPEEDEGVAELQERVLSFAGAAASLVLAVFSLRLFAHFAFEFGLYLERLLPSFAFLGIFISNLGEILGIIIGAAVTLGAGAFTGSLASRLGYTIAEKLPKSASKLINFPLGAVAGAVLFIVLIRIADWFYDYNNPNITLWGPLILGALFGLFVAFRSWKEDVVTTGMAIYYVSRTILNALRSIEALIMAIVFAVWVSIGPFAGVLALSLHTIAALAKLYSEQVESILTGPLEAVRATGATRMQTIIYAVIPQIVPPYIAFTIYRWDINVRMSTIIGFAGGGGIGFLLQQNINLLNYRAASAQMLAIAIVVATMDYISSSLRERII